MPRANIYKNRNTNGSVHYCGAIKPTPAQMKMLSQIADLVRGELIIDQVGHEKDPDWIKFHFRGLVDYFVMMTLELNSRRLGTEYEMREWQILCPADNSGLWLRHLSNPILQTQCRCGLWFY